MTNYVIRRLLLVPILLFGVTLIIFGMLQFLGPVERSALYVKDFPKNDKQIAWLTGGKAAWRFLTAPLRKGRLV